MIFAGKVEVVEEYDDEVRSVTMIIKIPAVVRLLRAIRPKTRAVKFSRINVMTRDGFRCQYCPVGSPRLPMSKLNYDHVVPRSQGGKTEWNNIVVACYPCNEKKRNRTPEQAGMRLLKKPIKPDYLPIVAMRWDFKDNIPDQWASYLYWQGDLEEGS